MTSRPNSQDDDFRFEPVRGLPAVLPRGEKMLWQGSPSWKAVARRALSTRLVIGWSVFVIAMKLVEAAMGQASAAETASAIAWMVVLAALALAIISVVIWAATRETIYTITSRRVVLRFGLVADLTINLPYSKIDRADLRLYRDGTGDLPLGLSGTHSLSYVHLWPNVRPWRWQRPEPMLRALPEAAKIGALLGDALRADLERREAAPIPVRIPTEQIETSPASAPAMPTVPGFGQALPAGE
ncbi:MAG: photosynthetic complex putative assembly protein PuhB [Pseudomonadota bacterium]